MPDKHEVGGSSPLGPTTRSKIELETNLIKRKRLFSSETRDKLIRWFESTWAYQKSLRDFTYNLFTIHSSLREEGRKMFIENRISI